MSGVGWFLVEAMGGKTLSKSVEMLSCLAGNIWKKFKPLADAMAWYR
jgi:hypothetical protein